MSNEEKSWSDSRQYCRDRGGDLVIINSEEKQRFISSLTTERVWIGLSDIEHESKMTWVDNSPLNQGFWLKEPGHEEEPPPPLMLEEGSIYAVKEILRSRRRGGGSRCLVLIAVGLGLICVLLLVFIILQYITITAERDLIKSYKNTAEQFNQTINSLQDNYTDLMTEKHQLQNNFNSCSQKNMELETRVKDLTAEKDQLQRTAESLSQAKLELESEIRKLSRRGLYKSLYMFSCT
ncbi:hypothetical protein QQF64_000058 [Cirrhinus molitorella]|uniref:C-type lectin domain-containing protein n=1 Tax=Cirrhinus molitorella TaxID=172907 RepID=A0ABR3NWJ5_9TELE